MEDTRQLTLETHKTLGLGLTCAELEQFFAEAIADGKGDDDSDEGVVSPGATGVPPPNPRCCLTTTVTPPASTLASLKTAVVSKEQQLLGGNEKGTTQKDHSSRGDPLERSEVIRRVLARKHVWSAVAIGSIVLGAGLILLAMRQSERRPPRRWETKRV